MPYAGIQDMSFYNILCEENFDDEIPTVFSHIGKARLALENIILQGLSGHMTRYSRRNTAVSSDTAILDHAIGAGMAYFANLAARALLELCISDNMR
jgi:hypothetical protein